MSEAKRQEEAYAAGEPVRRIPLGGDLPARLRTAAKTKVRQDAAEHIEALEAWIAQVSRRIDRLEKLLQDMEGGE